VCLAVDRHEHLHDVVFGKTVEDDRRHRELLAREAVDVGVQREQPVLPVNRAQGCLRAPDLEDPDARIASPG